MALSFAAQACPTLESGPAGPEQAAIACTLLGVKDVVPMHFGTFPELTGTPAKLRELAPGGVEVIELKPGETFED